MARLPDPVRLDINFIDLFLHKVKVTPPFNVECLRDLSVEFLSFQFVRTKKKPETIDDNKK